MTKTTRITIALLAVVALVWAACSDSGDPAVTTTSVADVTTIPATSGSTTTSADGQGSTTTTVDNTRETTTSTTTTGSTATTTATTSTTGGGTGTTTSTTSGGGGGTAAYGTNLDVLLGQCVGGDNIACDIMWLISAPDTEYETTGATCAGREVEADFCSGYTFADSDAVEYGDAPFLDALYDMCDAGVDTIACGLLCDITPPGSAYEAFGCSNAPFAFGDDVFLDSLWVACEGGDFEACDTLFFSSPVDSEYEEFGDTCGNRNEPSGSCVELYG